MSFRTFFLWDKSMSYRRAKALDKLVSQINAAYPGRDKSSDGWIGDAAHASRSSDHNPWVKDGKMGVVTAMDIDEDLAGDIHSIEFMVNAIRASRDPRVKYIIYEKRITVQGSNLQKWKKYTGTNAHGHHAHISVFPDKKLYDDVSPWSIGSVGAKPVSAVSPAASHLTTNELPQVNPATQTLQNPPEIATTPISKESAPVEVQVVSSAPSDQAPPEEKTDTLTKIGNKANAIWTAAGATVIAIVTFLTSTPLGIAVSIIGAVALVGIAYMIITTVRASGKEKRDAASSKDREEREFKLKIERESRDHEIQMALINAGASKDKNSVVLVNPPVIEIPNSDTSAGS